MTFDLTSPFEEDDEFDGEVVIPDSVEELLEEWERSDEVKAAKEALAEAEKQEAENKRIIDEAAKEIAEYEAKINALKNKMFTARRRSNSIEVNKRRANQVIQVAKDNYEAKLAEAKKLADVRNIDLDKFKWHSGVTLPDGKVIKILPHQTLAAEIIAAYGNIILADEMGVGKTLSMIAAMDYAKVKRALVVCPADVTSNFLNEIKMWAPHRHCVDMRGMSKIDRNAVFSMIGTLPNFVIVTNYESWRRDKSVLESLLDLGLEQIFMDEAHFMKNGTTNAYTGMKHVCHTTNFCVNCEKVLPESHRGNDKPCPYCGGHDKTSTVRSIIPATGTPILNSPRDIFTQLHLIDPATFSREWDFLRNYARQDYAGNWIFKPGGEKSLLTQLGYRFIKRTMNDVGIELPQQQVIHHELEWGDYTLQEEAYNELTKFGEILIGGTDEFGNPKKVSATSVLAQITRQRQCAVWPAGIQIKDDEGVIIASVGDRVNESVKIDKALSIIEEAYIRDERIVVFSQFATGLAELERRLSETPIRAVRFDGSTSQVTKDEVKRNFNASLGEDAKWDVVLANYRTGGVGLNLTACTTMIFLDMEWNPGKENQALKRVHRMGQTKRTFVHILSVDKTVDTWMRGLISFKQDILDGFNSEQKTLQEQYLEGIKSGEI